MANRKRRPRAFQGVPDVRRKPIHVAGRIAGSQTQESVIANMPRLDSEHLAVTRDIKLEDLEVDPLYQREISDPEVKQIALHFNPLKLGLLTVSARNDGKFYILDGQHRWLALVERGAAKASCEVLRGLTPEQEAAVFRARNKERRQLTAYGEYKASLAAGDPVMQQINDIVTRHEFRIGSPTRDRQGATIYAIDGLVRLHSWKVLEITLLAIRATWKDVPHATDRPMLLGVGAFWKLHEQTARVKDFAEHLASLPVLNLINEAQQRAASTMEHRGWAQIYRILLERYNKGLRSGRLPELAVPTFAMRHWTGERAAAKGG